MSKIIEERIIFDMAEFTTLARDKGLAGNDIGAAFIVHCTNVIAHKSNQLGLEGKRLLKLKEDANKDFRIIIFEIESLAEDGANGQA